MRIEHETFLIREGDFSNSTEFANIMDAVNNAIKCVSWYDDEKFVIKPALKANGVLPIKDNFIKYLEENGWDTEKRMSLAKGMNPGPIDATIQTEKGVFAVEWETGNISSSHRALNKIAVGIIQKQIIGGVLILPIKNLSKYLTDRIGNYEEIKPYFPLYNNINIHEGIIAVIGVDYDGIDNEAPLIKKGKDGNGKVAQGRARALQIAAELFNKD